MDNKTWSVEVALINGPEDLRETTRGSDVEIVQLKPGKLLGSIKHFGLGNLGISVGRFGSEIRARGPLHQEKVVLGTILASKGRISHWWKNVGPGDVGIFPPGVTQDAIYGGGGTYLVVSIALSELSSMLRGEDRLADPAFWNMKRLCRPDPRIGEEMRTRLKGIMSSVERKTIAPSAQAADFLQRSIIEAFVVSLTSTLPPPWEPACYTGARLVREAEDYVDAAGRRPVHISELCGALKVSRRSLHRTFAETLGIGPVAYLRRRRLSTIRSVLRRSDPATTSIGDLAFEHGFPEPGRFAAYYRGHFGESPLETLRSRSWGYNRKEVTASVVELAQSALQVFHK
jgi:AraC family ethanolamine operon transcriptional activator